MELIAFGFNAHGQLSPSTNPSEIPEDIRIPQIIASANNSLRVLFIGWSDTLQIDGNLHLLGAASANTQLTIPSTHLSPITCAFGDHTGLKGVTTSTQSVHLIQHYGTRHVFFGQRVEGISDTSHIAIAGNGVVAAVQGEEVLVYRSFSAFLLKNARQRWPLAGGGGVLGLHANEGGFVVLTREYGGRVITWGDARHEYLGRETTAEAPAGAPGIVGALDGIPIARVGSGGWCSAAVSAERDLYVWGGANGEVLAGRGEVELVQEFEVVDGVSVGDGHVVAWSGGKLWGIGRGENGQLGREGGRWRGEWREIEGVCRHGKIVRDVFCGGWSTLVICQRQESL